MEVIPYSNDTSSSTNLLTDNPFIIKLGLANKFAYTRDNRPVYRTFVCTCLPADDISWYERFFVEMKKIAVQLCYFGRGTPASIADLRIDDYYITFFYFDNDGDLNVLDSIKELSRVLTSTIQNRIEHIKFKADVITKPDRILGRKNNINSTTQVCEMMSRKMKALRMSANRYNGPHSSSDNIVLPSFRSPLVEGENNNIRNTTHVQQRHIPDPMTKSKSKDPSLLSSSNKSSKAVVTEPTNDKNSTPPKHRESLAFYATNCCVTVVNDTNSTAEAIALMATSPKSRTHVRDGSVVHEKSSTSALHSPQRLLSVLPGYGKKKTKAPAASTADTSAETERIVNTASNTGNSSRHQHQSIFGNRLSYIPSTSTDSAHVSIIKSSSTTNQPNNINNNNSSSTGNSKQVNGVDDFPTCHESLEEQSVIGSIDMWQTETLLSQDDDDNLSTQVFFQETTSQISI